MLFATTPAAASTDAQREASTGARDRPDYRGKLEGVPGSRVLVERAEGDSGKVVLGFTIKRLPRDCERGVDLLDRTRTGAVVEHDRFTGVFHQEPSSSTAPYGFTLIRGRVVDETRLTGIYFQAEDLAGPSECWTDGTLRWSAERVGRARHDAPKRSRPRPGAADQTGLFAGRFDDYEGSSVHLRVRGDRTATVRAASMASCTDGGRLKLDPIELRVDRKGRFERFIYERTTKPRGRSFTWVEGALKPGRRVEGRLAFTSDPFDPKSKRANTSECWMELAGFRLRRSPSRG